MKLVSYKLKNWGPHREQSLVFPQESQTIALCGENDKGKSWIVRGIGFTLSIGRNEYGDQSSIHSGEGQAYHQLIIAHNGNEHKIEKIVNGKSSEEGGTITKVNDTVVNRLEYEDFFKNTLGLPHPSVWLPICISMQNQTDFHLRSKKRDREEALRAICQLNKIDSWQEALKQIYKEEDKALAQDASRIKGTLDQITSELNNLLKKTNDYQEKLVVLKARTPADISWSSTLALAKEFEELSKEFSRKSLERANILKEINLLDNSIIRCEDELKAHNNKIQNLARLEQERDELKKTLQFLKIKELNKELMGLCIEEKTIKTESNGFITISNNFKLSEKESDLFKISNSIALFEEKFQKIKDLKSLLAIKNNLTPESIKGLISQRGRIKDLLSSSLHNFRTLSQEIKTLELSLKDLEQSLDIDIKHNLHPLNDTNTSDALKSELLKREFKNIAHFLRTSLLKEQGEHHPCPVCLQIINPEELKGKIKDIQEQTPSDLKDPKLKEVIELCAKLQDYNKKLQERDTWINEFGSVEAIEREIKELAKVLFNLQSLQGIVNDIELQIKQETRFGNDEARANETNTATINIEEKVEILIAKLKAKEGTIKQSISQFHTEVILKSKLDSNLNAQKKIREQINFHQEETKGQRDPTLENNLSMDETKKRVQKIEELLKSNQQSKEIVDKKNSELIELKSKKISLEKQSKELETILKIESASLKSGCGMPTPIHWQENKIRTETPEPPDDQTWENVSQEWLKRDQECIKVEAVLASMSPRIKELSDQTNLHKKKLQETEESQKRVTCAKKVIEFLDYKNAPRKLLEAIVTDLFEVTNKLAENLQVDIKLKLGKNLEFLTLQSRSGKWIEQKTERLGFGKGAILGICFRLACQKLLLPETGFLILDEPTANVDLKRKGLFKLFLQNLSQESNTKSGQIVLIEHDEDVVELCTTKLDIKETTT